MLSLSGESAGINKSKIIAVDATPTESVPTPVIIPKSPLYESIPLSSVSNDAGGPMRTTGG